MEYTEKDLVKIAKRENNTKRNYLVVDPLQGKHIPVVPICSIILKQLKVTALSFSSLHILFTAR